MSDLYGLFGEKLGHSLSPRIQSTLLEYMELKGYYHLFEMDKSDIEASIEGLKALRAKGVNVTVPYKIEVIKYLDDISEEAKKIGAVNTVVFNDKKTMGYNTDYYGFGIMVDKLSLSLEGKSAIVLGTGGASKAVVTYLQDNAIKEIVMVTRSGDKARVLTNETGIRHITYDELKDIGGFEIIINTTPCGMYPRVDESPVDIDMKGYSYALDLIYNPAETKFLRDARMSGLKTINGLYMLIGQALRAQEIWNDRSIDRTLIDDMYDEMIVEFEV